MRNQQDSTPNRVRILNINLQIKGPRVNLQYTMDFTTATTLEGYLEKQSPNIIKIFQKRYFTFRNKGEFLVWFKRKPNSVDDQPKGFIKVADILQVSPTQTDDRVFLINYPERNFILRAENKSSRDRWVEAIQLINQHIKRMTKYLQRQVDLEKQQKARAWRWQKADNEEVRLIRLQNEKLILNEGEDSIVQNSRKFQQQLMGVEIDSDFEKYVIFGYFNRKNFITTETRWFFLFSEFNLHDDGDQQPNHQVQAFADTLNKSFQEKHLPKPKNPKYSSSDSDDQPETSVLQDKIIFKINSLYEFDIKTKKLVSTLPLIEVNHWIENSTQSPFNLTIKYTKFQEGEQKSDLSFTEEQKEVVLFTNYLTEVKKWAQALKICFDRYHIAKQREKILEERFVRFKVKMFKVCEQEDWRRVGTEQKPEYVYLNREQIKIGGYTFNLALIRSLKSEKIKIEEGQDGEDKRQFCCSFEAEKQKVTIVFHNSEDEKALRKRAKKFIKKLQPYLQEKKIREMKHQIEEVDLGTYYIDKKIKESSSQMKINFYNMLQQENPNPKRRRQSKDASFFDRFLSMFCSAPVEQDLYF